MFEGVPEVSPLDVKRELDEGRELVIIDVRQPEEFEEARIEGTVLVPLGEIPEHLADFDSAADIVVHCKMGGRSAQAVMYMKANGFEKVRNMAGGILRWIDEVGPAIQGEDG